MSTIWLLTIAVLAPAAVVAPLYMEGAFLFWTRGRIPFDATLIGLFAIGVLVYAFSQPASSVLQGQNRIRPQVVASTSATLVALGGTIATTPFFGVKGAAASLIAGELVGCVYSVVAVRRTFQALNMTWPYREMLITALSLLASCVLIAATMRTDPPVELIVSMAFGLAAMTSIVLLRSMLHTRKPFGSLFSTRS